jgi:hypothetical protein
MLHILTFNTMYDNIETKANIAYVIKYLHMFSHLSLKANGREEENIDY